MRCLHWPSYFIQVNKTTNTTPVLRETSPLVVPASHEVWARAAWLVVDVIQRANLAMSMLFEGLAYDAAQLRHMHRIPWDDYATLCERARTLVGSDDDLDDLVEETYQVGIPELARTAIEPKSFVRFIHEVLDPIAFNAVDYRSEDLGPDRMRLVARLRPGALPCRAFFRGNVGALRGCTRHLDLPRTEVTYSETGPDYGIYELRLPRPRTLGSRGRRASYMSAQAAVARFILGADEHGHSIGVSVGPTDVFGERLHIVASEWELTRRQIAVLKLVVRGESNKEIAQALGCAENTVELHVTQLLRKADVASRARLIARFWSDE